MITLQEAQELFPRTIFKACPGEDDYYTVIMPAGYLTAAPNLALACQSAVDAMEETSAYIAYLGGYIQRRFFYLDLSSCQEKQDFLAILHDIRSFYKMRSFV